MKPPASAIRRFRDLLHGATFFWLPPATAAETGEGAEYACFQKVSDTEGAALGTGRRQAFRADELVLLRIER